MTKYRLPTKDDIGKECEGYNNSRDNWVPFTLMNIKDDLRFPYCSREGNGGGWSAARIKEDEPESNLIQIRGYRMVTEEDIGKIVELKINGKWEERELVRIQIQKIYFYKTKGGESILPSLSAQIYVDHDPQLQKSTFPADNENKKIKKDYEELIARYKYSAKINSDIKKKLFRDLEKSEGRLESADELYGIAQKRIKFLEVLSGEFISSHHRIGVQCQEKNKKIEGMHNKLKSIAARCHVSLDNEPKTLGNYKLLKLLAEIVTLIQE